MSRIHYALLAVAATALTGSHLTAQQAPQVIQPTGPGGPVTVAAYSDYTGFTKIWDGKTFDGWDGETDAWSIENDAIHMDTAKKGGQHHICFEVESIIAARDDMVAKGATVLNNGQPRIGAHGVPVIFVHPKNMGGVLVELMETPHGDH